MAEEQKFGFSAPETVLHEDVHARYAQLVALLQNKSPIPGHCLDSCLQEPGEIRISTANTQEAQRLNSIYSRFAKRLKQLETFFTAVRIGSVIIGESNSQQQQAVVNFVEAGQKLLNLGPLVVVPYLEALLGQSVRYPLTGGMLDCYCAYEVARLSALPILIASAKEKGTSVYEFAETMNTELKSGYWRIFQSLSDTWESLLQMCAMDALDPFVTFHEIDQALDVQLESTSAEVVRTYDKCLLLPYTRAAQDLISSADFRSFFNQKVDCHIHGLLLNLVQAMDDCVSINATPYTRPKAPVTGQPESDLLWQPGESCPVCDSIAKDKTEYQTESDFKGHCQTKKHKNITKNAKNKIEAASSINNLASSSAPESSVTIKPVLPESASTLPSSSSSSSRATAPVPSNSRTDLSASKHDKDNLKVSFATMTLLKTLSDVPVRAQDGQVYGVEFSARELLKLAMSETDQLWERILDGGSHVPKVVNFLERHPTTGTLANPFELRNWLDWILLCRSITYSLSTINQEAQKKNHWIHFQLGALRFEINTANSYVRQSDDHILMKLLSTRCQNGDTTLKPLGVERLLAVVNRLNRAYSERGELPIVLQSPDKPARFLFLVMVNLLLRFRADYSARHCKTFLLGRSGSEIMATACREGLFRKDDVYISESYPKLGKAFIEAMKKDGLEMNERELVQRARRIMVGQELDTLGQRASDRLFAMVLLAMFISEVRRAPSTLLSGLMLFDLAESRIQHHCFDLNGVASVINSDVQGLGSRGRRHYGFIEMFTDINFDEDGSGLRTVHPMTRGGTYDAIKAEKKESMMLTRSRQQEGDILIRWLYYQLRAHLTIRPLLDIPQTRATVSDPSRLPWTPYPAFRENAENIIREFIRERLLHVNFMRCEPPPRPSGVGCIVL